MTESYSRHQQPSHRRKTPSFSSSLLDSILRSIDESNDAPLHDNNGNNNHNRFCVSEPKRSNKNQQQRIDQWMETHGNNNNRYGYVSSTKSYNKFSSDSSSSGTETPSTYRSLPNSFTAVFLDDTQKASSSSTKVEGKFMRSTKLKAMKIYDELKKPNQKQKQPVSPGRRISAFICSLFTSSKKAKQDKMMTSTLSSSKKQASSSVKRSVRFYPVKDTVIMDQKSIDERDYKNLKTSPNYMKNYKNFVVSTEDDDEEDDLFELEIAGGYGRELPVFETTDLRKIRI